jgi:hypothetical protein
MLKTKYAKKNKTNTELMFRKLAYCLEKEVANSTQEIKTKGKLFLSYEKNKGYRIVETIDNKGHFHYPLGEMYFPPRLFVDVLDFTIKAIQQSK